MGYFGKVSIRVVVCYGNEGECGRGVDLIYNFELFFFFFVLDGSWVWGLIDVEGVDLEIVLIKFICDGDGVFDCVGKCFVI